MADFGIFPPEVISGWLSAGPGNSSLLAASTAWQELSQELESFTESYGSILGNLGGVWRGPSATAMTEAVLPYVSWLHQTAGQAAQLSIQAANAASAFYTAVASAVPLPVIMANRVQTQALISTNLLGQNAPAIAAQEAQYLQMWAQNVTVMNVYQANSYSATSSLTPFTAAPTTTSGLLPFLEGTGPLGSIFEAVFQATPGAVLNQYISGYLGSGFPIDLFTLFAAGSIANGVGGMASAAAQGGSAKIINSPEPTPSLTEIPSVSASMGTGQPLGRLTTPPSWTQPLPPKPPPARPLPAPTEGGQEEEGLGIPVIPAIPVMSGRNKKKSRGSDPDEMPIGLPTGPVMPRYPI